MDKDEAAVQRVEVARSGSVGARDGTLLIATAGAERERGRERGGEKMIPCVDPHRALCVLTSDSARTNKAKVKSEWKTTMDIMERVCPCVCVCVKLFERSGNCDLLVNESSHDLAEDLVETATHVLGQSPSIPLLQLPPTHTHTHTHTQG